MTTRQSHGDGVYIDFGKLPKEPKEPAPSAPREARVQYERVVKIAWYLVASVAVLLVVIIFLSVRLNSRNQTIRTLVHEIEILKKGQYGPLPFGRSDP
jgi:hypothetical protein